MKISYWNSIMGALPKFAWPVYGLAMARSMALTGGLLLSVHAKAAEPEGARTFSSPDEAVSCLATALRTQDEVALRAMFGSDLSDVENPDRVQATNEWAAFGAALAAKSHIDHSSAAKCILEVGTNSWPFAIPIVQQNGRWFFDVEAGEDELLNRRIGKNELATLEVVRTYVQAQREYASQDRDGDQVLEYAQKLRSSPGTHNGLYWPPGSDGEISPLGPLVADAQGTGYHLDEPEFGEIPAPFHGYYFKILLEQGRHAPGGKHSFVINGNMVAGFALVAWPARYGDSGIMTFIVNQQGIVYQKDLGKKTEKAASRMKAYDPDESWAPSPD